MKAEQWWFEQGRLYAELLMEVERLREENKILRLKYEVKKKKEVSNGTDD
jgi:hypothetical protein